jgi:hypothetical protein
MDPNVAYQMMADAMAAGDRIAAYEHADNLRTWMLGGGFPPDIPDAHYWINAVWKFYRPAPAVLVRGCLHF